MSRVKARLVRENENFSLKNTIMLARCLGIMCDAPSSKIYMNVISLATQYSLLEHSTIPESSKWIDGLPPYNHPIASFETSFTSIYCMLLCMLPADSLCI
jgi:hypothetical protein